MKKILGMFIAIISIFAMFTVPVSAAKGYEGYAIYRDGAFKIPVVLPSGFDWHAGLLDEPSTSYYKPVTHISGPSPFVIKYDSWSNFIDGNTSKGVYKPKSGVTSAQRDLVKSMGRRLISENISYNAVVQVDWYTSCLGNWVFPDDIASVRCDGVVEYAYEYYGIKIYGSDSTAFSEKPHWDVTWGNVINWDHHSGTAITPKKQCQNYMTRVLSYAPTGTYN